MQNRLLVLQALGQEQLAEALVRKLTAMNEWRCVNRVAPRTCEIWRQ